MRTNQNACITELIIQILMDEWLDLWIDKQR